MRGLRWIAFLLIGVVLLSAAPAAVAQGLLRLPVVQRNNNFCFDRNIRIGNIVITGNQCYTTYLVNTSTGGFLGFGPAGTPLIAPGQIGQMEAPAGSVARGRMLYMLPLNRRLALPINGFQFVLPQFSLQNGRLVINVPIAQGRFATLQSDDRMPGEQDK